MPIPNTPLLLLQEQSDEDAYDDATQKFEPFVDGSLQPVGTVPPKEDPEKEANESKPLHPETPVAPPRPTPKLCRRCPQWLQNWLLHQRFLQQRSLRQVEVWF